MMKRKLIILLLVSITTFIYSTYSYAAKDVGVSQIIAPYGVANLADSIYVKAWVKNYGTQAVDGIPIVYSINTVDFYDTLFIGNQLLSGDSVLFISRELFVSPIGFFMFCVKTQLLNDANSNNDMVCTSVYGDFMGPSLDLNVQQIRAINSTGKAGSKDTLEVLVNNSGAVNVSTINLKYKLNQNSSHIDTFSFSQPLLVDSSRWFRLSQKLNRNPGNNTIITTIDNSSDINPYNDTLIAVLYGSPIQFDISVDSFELSPTWGDTTSIYCNTTVTVYASNKGLDTITQPVYFLLDLGPMSIDNYIINNTVLPSQSFSFVFSNSFYCPLGYYGLRVFTNFPLDSNTNNNELYKVYLGMAGACASIKEQTSSSFELYSPQPNPATNTVAFKYTIKKKSEVDFTLMDSQGRIVYRSQENKTPGDYKIQLDVSNYARGIYFYRFGVDGQSEGGKLMIVR